MKRLIYPERRTVTNAQLLIWADDALANGETQEKAETVEDAIRILEDLGHIGIDRSSSSKEHAEKAYLERLIED